MNAARWQSRAGLSLVEVLVALALLSFVVLKGVYLIESATDYSRNTSSAMVLEDAAEQVLDKIVYALVGSDRDSLMPTKEAPLYSTDMTYRISFGMENGEVVWSEPECINLEATSSVVWSEKTGLAGERRAVWTNLVRPFLEGEIANGMDDNGNGLVDESGLTFEVDGSTVVVRLTLATDGGESRTASRSVEATVACRNFLERSRGLDVRYK